MALFTHFAFPRFQFCSSRIAVLACIVLAVASASLQAQSTDATRNFPVSDNGAAYEIHRIEFVGALSVSPAVLREVIATRASEKSTARSISEFYRMKFERAPSIFTAYAAEMKRFEHNLDDVREYFNRERVAPDTFRIKAYYNERGFHNISVQVDFTHDAAQRENVLTFYISEVPPARLRALVYIGFDSLPPDVAALVREAQTVETGEVFSQARIADQNRRITELLRNSGYFYAACKAPLVLYNPEANTDSVTVFYTTGRRQRIGDIFFADSTEGQPAIAAALRREMLEFREGDWYNYSAVVRSEENFYNLGVYASASIDTSSERAPHTDSTLNFRVLTRMQKMRHIGGSILANKDQSEPFWNAGVEGYIEHRNALHKAQAVRLYGRLLGIDINSWIERGFRRLPTEAEVGVRLQQPYFFTTPFARVGAGAQFFYSRQIIYKPLWLASYGGISSLTWRFTNNFTGFTELSFASERPINFDIAYEKLLAQPGAIGTVIRRQLYQYAKLDTIVNIRGNFLSKIILGNSIAYDTRSSPFAPDSGIYAAGSLEGGLGGTKFIRAAATYLDFTPISSSEVLALKFKLGHIFWFDRANTYIPLDRHFFAGGSNSIRAFASRELRAEPIDTSTADEVRNLADFIGSGSLFEGSVEYRLQYLRAPLTNEFWDQLLGRLGGAVFLDFGNAYNSFLENPSKYAAKKPSTFLKKIAVGFGAGIRFATPIGPLRFDLAAPLYNPMAVSSAPLQALHWHVGIGHAF